MLPRRYVTALAVLPALAAMMPGQTTPDKPPSFEVASVKQSRADQRPTALRIDPARLSVMGTSLKHIIMMAYDIPVLDSDLVTGGPHWVESEAHDLECRSETPVSREGMLLMLRSLLADRFQLKLHRETKPVAMNVLSIAKTGPKFGPDFHAVGEGDPPANPEKQRGRQIYPDITFKAFLDRLRVMMTRDPVTDTFVGIQNVLPILDKTGLAGRYYISFKIDTHEDWSAALEHQLGLKLDWRMVPTEIIVIDSAAKPSGN